MQNSIPCENRTMPCISAGHNTVKHIYTASNTLNDIRRRAHTHQISGLIHGHIRFHLLNDMIHDFGRLSDCQSPDCITIQPKLCNLLHMRYTNRIICAALIDAKQHLLRIDGSFQTVQALHFLLTADQPACCSGTGIFHVFQGRRIFYTFIKCHCNGGAEIGLNLHAFFRPHKNCFAINVRLKVYTLFLDPPQLCQRKYLKPTAVC